MKCNSNVLQALKKHLADWILIIILACLAGASTTIRPNHRYITQDEADTYMYPYHQHETVPSWALPIIALGPALLIFVLFKIINKITCDDLQRSIIGLLGSFLITVIITNVYKNFAGRPRPHFFDRCFPDADGVYNFSGGEPDCEVKDAWRSFPSGHSSETMSGLMFLSLFLFNWMDVQGRLWEAVIVITPLFCGGVVAISRVKDYYHHWQDVVAGYLLGSFCAILVYYYFFPVSQQLFVKTKSTSRSRSASQHVRLDESNEMPLQQV
eukprot:TRINITY_DN3975_c0_g1_i10.p1 TRINITY_DN3975_c0_g1~~TRINITY_DN3975_c0_g1_i10.p1  ORF type:complete len:268 (-),score=47.62 TRINITY_DN3975_c0_g1_i10:1879-2682(-)